jgi:hypothetical protein
MTGRPFNVGEKALVSRDESGEKHEEATVVDYYVLLIGEESRPMVVVEFDDGERKWITATEPNVLAIEPEGEEEQQEGSEAGEDDAGEVSADELADESDNGDGPAEVGEDKA